jgi:hypothetical protein
MEKPRFADCDEPFTVARVREALYSTNGAAAGLSKVIRTTVV